MSAVDALLAIAPWLLLAYALVVATYITLENRSPQSTLLWLLLCLTLPVVGLVIYRFVGRGWRAFIDENALVHHELGSDLLRDLDPILARRQEYVV